MKSVLKTAPFICLLIMIYGCGSSCCEFLYSYKLDSNLTIEKYRTYCGGVHAGESYTTYITDGISFRFKLGLISNSSESLEITKTGNTIIANTLRPYTTEEIISKDSFSILGLKKSYEYEKFNKQSPPLVGNNLVENFDKHTTPYVSKLNGGGLYTETMQYQWTTNDSIVKSHYINAIYLTDRTNFKVLVGYYDMDKWTKGRDHYRLNCINDTLFVTQYNSLRKSKIIKSELYDLNIIKQESFKKACE